MGDLLAWHEFWLLVLQAAVPSCACSDEQKWQCFVPPLLFTISPEQSNCITHSGLEADIVKNIPDTYSCLINKLSPAANVKAPAATKQMSAVNVQTSAAIKKIHTATMWKTATTKRSPAVSMQAPAATKKTSTSTVQAPTVHAQNPVTTKLLPAATKQMSTATTQKPVTTKLLPAVNMQAPAATEQMFAATAQAPAATKLLPAANMQMLAATAQALTTLASPTCKPSSNQAPMGQPATCQPLPSHASRPVPIHSFGK
ncbi:hypothetical protein DSO57_1032204 [Entomophthora muscae]|uniref:Uncharacterized protein n=1 Tax=Entomophthora muscae TaxID=34485 RepID=A0ACC2SD79_9FUNG|nr:hypothetical protein DSO57_1032204 [Entomophthora muscae]